MSRRSRGSDRFPLFFFLFTTVHAATPPPPSLLPAETSVFTQITIKRNGGITLVETIVLPDKSCRLCILTGKSFEIISYIHSILRISGSVLTILILKLYIHFLKNSFR